MSDVLPLTAHARTDAIVAWRADGPVTLARFLGDVLRLADALPAGTAMLNVCEDRYRFMVGFAAALLAGKPSLLPASQSVETLRQLGERHEGLFCLHDGKPPATDLPMLAYPALPAASGTPAVPAIPAAQLAVVMFTSGSTGTPVAQAKTWGALVKNGRAEAERLGLPGNGHAIVGTVPVQHSYGFESTLLLTLHGDGAMWSGRPFYPADIAAAVAAVPRPRMLVTTPFHLRALLESGVAMPALDLVLSATAPLSVELANQAEMQLHAPLYEIYGCTETGQLASRRTVAGPAWQPFPGIRLEQKDGVTFASGGHVEGGRQRLGDVIELNDDGSFLLHGRGADMVNIAGKRTSLAYLNHQLAAIPGVEDGCFFLPDGDDGQTIVRLAAFVVAPRRTAGEIFDALRQRLDPVFLPRPLVMLDRLPRNATGKLPRAELQALLDGHLRSAP